MTDTIEATDKKDGNYSSRSIRSASCIEEQGQLPPWYTRYIPGPNYAKYNKNLAARWMRAGTVACGSGCLMLSGYSEFHQPVHWVRQVVDVRADLALMGNVSSTPSYLKVVNLSDGSQHTQLLIGLVNSMYWIGVLLGALIISPISDAIGRRKALVLTGIYGLLIIPIFTGLQSFTWALVLRLLNGIATGAFDSVGLNWSAEIADHRHRGRVIGAEMVCGACGASQAYFLVYGLNKDTTSQLIWRFPLAFQLVFLLFVLVLAFILPESPRWLLRNGHVNETKGVLFSLNADRGSSSEIAAQIDSEVVSIQQAVEQELSLQKKGTNYLHMLFSQKDRYQLARRSWSAIFVQFACQAMVGAGVASGYGMKIFMTGGWSSDISSLLAGMGIVTQMLFGAAGAAFSDKLGRRKAMIYGSLFGAVIFVMIGLCGHYIAQYKEIDPDHARQYSKGVIALVFTWSAQYGFTWCMVLATFKALLIT